MSGNISDHHFRAKYHGDMLMIVKLDRYGAVESLATLSQLAGLPGCSCIIAGLLLPVSAPRLSLLPSPHASSQLELHHSTVI